MIQARKLQQVSDASRAFSRCPTDAVPRCRMLQHLDAARCQRVCNENVTCQGVRSTAFSRASSAQLVAVVEMNCDFPPGSPLSKKTCTARLRVVTSQPPSVC